MRAVDKTDAIEKASFEVGDGTKYLECSAKNGEGV